MSDGSTCRSCEAPIEWAVTNNGRRIPLDIAAGDKPNIVIDAGVAYAVPPGKGDRTSHFVTCPNSAAHRRR